jgi:hypothetical protein
MYIILSLVCLNTYTPYLLIPVPLQVPRPKETARLGTPDRQVIGNLLHNVSKIASFLFLKRLT